MSMLNDNVFFYFGHKVVFESSLDESYLFWYYYHIDTFQKVQHNIIFLGKIITIRVRNKNIIACSVKI